MDRPRVQRRIGCSKVLLVLALSWTLAGGHADAAPAGNTAAEVILDEIGPGWTRVKPDPQLSTSNGASRLFLSVDMSLTMLAEPRLDCITGTSGRSAQLALVRSLHLQAVPSVTPGVDQYTGDIGPGTAGGAALFTTDRFAFLLLAGANHENVDTVPVLDAIAVEQAARDGGIVIESPPPTNRLDDIILVDPPVSDLGDGTDFPTNQTSCDTTLGTSKIAEFLSTHSTSRSRGWVNLSTSSLAAIDLTDFPYDLFAGVAAGGALSATFRPVSPEGIGGLDVIPNVRAWRIDGPQPQYFARFRRGTIVAMVTVSDGSETARARKTLARLAVAQYQAMPSGATTALNLPSSAKSVAESGALIALIGVGALGTRRVRAGRITRTAVVRDDVHSVDISRRASVLRRRGTALGAIQVACVVAIVVFLAADLGWIRLVGAAATVLLGIGITMLWRRREALLLEGATRPRARPSPSMASVALTIAAMALLGGGGSLVVWGLRETLFIPSLTHLRISDRVSIEPRLLGWMLAAIGLLLIVVGSFVLRAARAVARIGWREWATEEAPIVYLRSFEDDDVQLANVVSARRPFLEFFTLRGRDAFEESVAWELSTYGPVLAIARPGGSRISLGAARMYLSDDQWRGEISEQIAQAKAVAITIGRTPGLAWEITHIVRSGSLTKTIFVVPPVDPSEIQLRWTFISDALAAAGAGHHPLLAEPACLVTVEVQPTDGVTTAYCADRRDEATYRAAVAAALA
jgi:hypothetical protein